MVRIDAADFRSVPALALVPGEIVDEFGKRFGSGARAVVYRAPGRVNLIGEHTDYNLGYVLPIALDMACYVAIAPASHACLRIYSRNLDQEFCIAVADLANAKPTGQWSDYVVGVARELAAIEPCDLYIASDVPAGSGLSSSAALEISAAVALLGERVMEKVEIAKLGQRAESQFVGMPCGIMDQYAAVFGYSGAALKIDCRSLEHEYVELPSNVRIIAVNSLVKHELGTSAYRERVAECQAAVAAIQKSDPDVKSLRDVTPEHFETIQDTIPSVPRRRARHVISETQRVVDFSAAARKGDLREMGRLFVTSHRSMQHDYEISCEEIDFLVDTAIELPGVYGARMTGGGFGGCTVNLVAPEDLETFQQRLAAAYQERYGKIPAF
ncbi:MAG TPA: galactokinase, partial [Chthoniobacterales bacterium]|nr:galactokinase [Chthoniobacterales bacterium]